MCRSILALLLVFTYLNTVAQRQITVKVIDIQTKKPIKDAKVQIVGTSIETITNVLGFFRLDITSDSTHLILTHPEYEPASLKTPDSLSNFLISLKSLPPVSVQGIEVRDTTRNEWPKTDKSAEFPGGSNAMWKYIKKNLKYSADAKNKHISGRVLIGFVVENDGSITGVKLIKGIYPSIDEEAVRVIQNSPKWKPGKLNDRPVRSRFVIPINVDL